jgi:hypothetical protein
MWVKAATALFLAAFVRAHLSVEETVPLPLSQLRDGRDAWLGHLMFAALIALAGTHAWSQLQRGYGGEALSTAVAAALLVFVALSPSFDAFHILASLLLLTLLFIQNARLLRELGLGWMAFHLLVPTILLWASRQYGYGVWQKGLILYLLTLTNLRNHVLGHERFALHWREPVPRLFDNAGEKRRRVYRLAEPRSQAERGIRSSSVQPPPS